MPRLSCPHCKQVLTVAEEQRGTVTPCPGCQRPIRVPAAKPGAAETRKDRGDAVPRPVLAASESAQARVPATKAGVHAPADESEEEETQDTATKSRFSAAGILSGLGGLVLLLGLILLLSGKWVKWIADPIQKLLDAQGIHPAVAIAGTAVILLIPVGLFLASLTKSTIIGAIPEEVDFRLVQVSDFPDLDRPKLAASTEALERLGFQPVADYTVVTDLNTGVRGFGRLFYHEQHGCFAEVNQAFKAAGDPTLMRLNLASLLGDGWSVATGNRRPTKENYLLRRPRAVWKSFPDERTTAVLRGHLDLRQRLIDALGVEVIRDGSAAAYFKHEKAAARERKDRVRSQSAVRIVLELWLFERYPKLEWLGDFAKKAR